MMWTKITIEALKLSWHIISTSPEDVTWEPVRRVVCEECKKIFDDELDGDGKYISNVMNYAKFTAVMAGSITLKNDLKDQKILPV